MDLDEHYERTSAAVRLLISRIRNVDHVIAREAEYRSQRVQHAEHQIRPSVAPNFLANGSVRRCIIEQVLQHIWANDANLTTRSSLAFGPDPSDIDRHAID